MWHTHLIVHMVYNQTTVSLPSSLHIKFAQHTVVVCTQRAGTIHGDSCPFRAYECRCRVRFQVLTVASMNIRVFWDVAICNPAGADRRFRGACCRLHQGWLMMEAVLTCETQVYVVDVFKARNAHSINPEDTGPSVQVLVFKICLKY
jgi:hypothetical protein